jgi:hypothetical protein
MLCTSELNMAESVKTSDIDVFLSDAAWAIHSTYHPTVLKTSPGAAIFGQDMLFVGVATVKKSTVVSRIILNPPTTGFVVLLSHSKKK